MKMSKKPAEQLFPKDTLKAMSPYIYNRYRGQGRRQAAATPTKQHIGRGKGRLWTVRWAAVVLMVASLVGCHQRQGALTADGTVPREPDYGDTTQWFVSHRQADVDLFYVISTETGDYTTADGTLCHYADTYNDSVRGPMLSEMVGVDTLIGGSLNFYSPYYRQCSLQSFADDSTLATRLPIALQDVKKAFAYYLKELNGGRPFVLAGFSQGASIVVELMKEMDETTAKRMVAAYVIGIGIKQEMLDSCKRLVPAQRADDTGVTICYNSVRDAKSALPGLGLDGVVCINPVNWKTDATPATLATEPTPLQPLDSQQKDTMTVCIDTLSHLLTVDGYSATDYVLPLLGKEGNYHTREIWLYRDCLRENIALRAARFMEKRMGK